MRLRQKRRENKLTQENIATCLNVTPRYIGQIESLTEPSIWEMTQASLSHALNMADSFVSNVESLKRRDKYNVNHLNQLAKIFKCSPKDFLPEKPI